MLKRSLLCAAICAAAATANAASNCDELLAQIDAKIRDAGVTRFTLAIVAAEATVGGKVVGTCERGSKKIVYEAEAASPSPGIPPRSPGRGNDGILTECRDGSVSIGGDCRN